MTSTNDSGGGSLRDAIDLANAHPGMDTIDFAIPGTGPHTISVTSVLPVITDPVIIDGYTQPGASANTLDVGDNAVLQIEVDGSMTGSGAPGLVLATSDSTIRGLVINGFSDSGIVIDGSFVLADNNTIEGNFIGLDPTGTVDRGNFIDGIFIQGASGGSGSNNTIGGPTPAARNVISGNGFLGVEIFSQYTANGNVIQGNYIGTDAAGTSGIGNDVGGVVARTTDATHIIGNVISDNGGNGIDLVDSVTNSIIQGNLIGVDATGATALGNSGDGVRLILNDQIDNLIGGTGQGEGNVIAFNGGAGVEVTSTSGEATVSGNTIRRNSIFGNGGLGIDLGGDGVTANDVGDADSGANALQNFPVITAISGEPGNITVTGTLHSTPNTTFDLDFFSSVSPDASGFGEGQTPIIPTSGDSVTTDDSGDAFFSASFTGNFFGQHVTATATAHSAPFDTSEFSAAVLAVEAPSLVVTTTVDVVANDGFTSLREAINLANETPGLDTISFAIPDAGVQTITPTSALPIITDPVIIDGYTQQGASANTLAVGDNAVLLIELSGAMAPGAEGLVIAGGGSTVRGLVINRWTGFFGAIRLTGEGDNTVTGNFIGTDASGTSALPNTQIGIYVTGGSNNNTIGGPDPADRNVLSGNSRDGIYVGDTVLTGTVIQGNYIGVDATGVTGLGNGSSGVAVNGGPTSTLIEGNVLSANSLGVFIGDNTSNTMVQGNLIGTDATGTADLGNETGGIQIDGSANNTVGGGGLGEGNLIAFNGNYGIDLTLPDSNNNTVSGNIITGNMGSGVLIEGGATDNTLGGTTVSARNIISGNLAAGVTITGPGTSGNLVQGNYIGVDDTGATGLGNLADGVSITNGASDNTIGGTDAGAGNVISSNVDAGVNIHDTGTTGNVVQGNLIGTDATGSFALGNSDFGVIVQQGGSNTTIGGTTAGARNIISGNGSNAVVLTFTDNNTVQGNYIGTDITGMVDVGNGLNGIATFMTTENMIGGTEPGAGNVISGNGGDGIAFFGGSNSNIVQGNLIGVDVTGTVAVGNDIHGIFIDSSSGNIIGGTDIGAGNVIAASRFQGVYLFGGTDNTLVQGNAIGTDATGSLDLGNRFEGVRIEGSQNTIGGTTAGAGNLIAFNERGVVVTGEGPRFNAILGNSIFANAGLGIDLDDDGVTPNDSGTFDGDNGANGLQNTPTITSVSGNHIIGFIDSEAGTLYRIEFFATPLPSVPGQGKTFLGFTEVTTGDNGRADFDVFFADAVLDGMGITATAANVERNETSEFSPGPPRSVVLSGFPSPIAAGQEGSFHVDVLDDFGSVATGYRGTVTFSSSETRAELVQLPADYTFQDSDNGSHDFSAIFRRAGTMTVTVTDTSNPDLTASQSDIVVTSSLQAMGLLIIPIVNLNFSGVVATFTDTAGTPTREYTALINWGDGTPLTMGNIVTTTGGYQVLGSHTYTTVDAFFVDVLITRPSTGQGETAESSAEVLSGAEGGALADFGFDRCQPGDSTLLATSSGVTGTLTDFPMDADCDVLLFVATYKNNPEPAPVNGIAFYDSRVLGSDRGGQLRVVLSYPDVGNAPVTLLYFDGTAYRPVQSTSLTIDTARRMITVVFDSNSMPMLKDLRGTVLTVALVGPGTPPPAVGSTFTAPTASAGTTTTSPDSSLPTASRIISDSGSGGSRSVSFRTGNSLNISLTPGESSAVVARTAASGGDSSDTLPPDEQLEAVKRFLRRLLEQLRTWSLMMTVPAGAFLPNDTPMSTAPTDVMERERLRAIDGYFSTLDDPDDDVMPFALGAGLAAAAAVTCRRRLSWRKRR